MDLIWCRSFSCRLIHHAPFNLFPSCNTLPSPPSPPFLPTSIPPLCMHNTWSSTPNHCPIISSNQLLTFNEWHKVVQREISLKIRRKMRYMKDLINVWDIWELSDLSEIGSQICCQIGSHWIHLLLSGWISDLLSNQTPGLLSDRTFMILLGQGEHLKMKFLTLLCNFFHFITLSFTVLRAGLELSLLPSTSDNIYITFHYTNFLWLPLDNCNQLVMTQTQPIILNLMQKRWEAV